MNAARRIPALALSAVVALAACRREPHDPITGTGTLEVVEVDVAPTVPARITRIWVEEGARVRAGDTLVSLTQPTARPDVEARRARLASAEAQLRDLEAGARPAELERAQAELRAAEAEATRTAQDLARMTPLARNGTISAQQFDAVRSAASTAAARRDAAREALRLLREGTRPERIRAARAEVENARAALAAAEGTASDLVLTAPVSGAILARYAEPGEILAAGEPSLTIGEVGKPWVRIYVGQSALPRIHVGDAATATLDDFPNRPFGGRVVSINDKAEFTPRVALTEEERADLLFGVKVELRDTTGMLKAGLPVTVRLAGSGPARRPTVEPSDRPRGVPISSRP